MIFGVWPACLRVLALRSRAHPVRALFGEVCRASSILRREEPGKPQSFLSCLEACAASQHIWHSLCPRFLSSGTDYPNSKGMLVLNNKTRLLRKYTPDYLSDTFPTTPIKRLTLLSHFKFQKATSGSQMLSPQD